MKNQKDWSLPNFYLDEEKDIELASKNVLSKLIYNDLSNSSFINFKTKIDDVLPSCISVSYIVINKFEKIRMSYNSKISDLNWVELNDHPELNEKQRDIFKKSKIYLENLIKNSPKKVLYFLPKYFTLSELQHSLQILVNDNKNFKYSPHSNFANFQILKSPLRKAREWVCKIGAHIAIFGLISEEQAEKTKVQSKITSFFTEK